MGGRVDGGFKSRVAAAAAAAFGGDKTVARDLEINQEVPVIFLTVLSDQIYEEAALLSGAVDFVEKSRSFTILIKRMDLILGGLKAGQGGAAPANQNGESASVLTVGGLELNLDSNRAFWRQGQVELTLTEFEIVRFLASRAGQDVRYREIYDLVHGRGFVAGEGPEGYRANVRTFIKRIRQKFRSIDAEFEQIFGRVKARKLDYWADPGKRDKGRTNAHFGGRGVYFEDPGGHLLEIITRPYGSWDQVK